MSSQHAGNIAGPSNKDAFSFVQALALEMSAGKIEIPSFPDVAVRMRKVLADDNVNAQQVARVVSAEPALAAKLLQIANSVALNPNGRKWSNSRAPSRASGFSNVRSASLAYAMDQIKNAPALAPIRKPLNELWERSVKVAAMSFVVARSWSKVNADSALLAGLMHGMGRVYILTRAVKHPALFADAAAYQQIVRDWHTSIAKAVLESWEISAADHRGHRELRGPRSSQSGRPRPHRRAHGGGPAGFVPRGSRRARNASEGDRGQQAVSASTS